MHEVLFGSKAAFGIRFGVEVSRYFFIQFWISGYWIGDFTVSQDDDATRSSLLMIAGDDIRSNAVFRSNDIVPEYKDLGGFGGGEAFDSFGLSIYRVSEENLTHFKWELKGWRRSVFLNYPKGVQHQWIKSNEFNWVVFEFDSYIEAWRKTLPIPSPPYIRP